jgi:hypothetical protein
VFGTSGHFQADKLGFTLWRRTLRDACFKLRNSSLCSRVYVHQAGGGLDQMASAVQLYARSTFCLQPPGDVLARSAIVDAVLVGCVPVFFHPGQQQLWPLHWRADAASVLFDWTKGSERNASRVMRELIEMPQAQVSALQDALRRVAPSFAYRGGRERAQVDRHAQSDLQSEDAVDVLVRRLPAFLASMAPG